MLSDQAVARQWEPSAIRASLLASGGPCVTANGHGSSSFVVGFNIQLRVLRWLAGRRKSEISVVRRLRGVSSCLSCFEVLSREAQTLRQDQ